MSFKRSRVPQLLFAVGLLGTSMLAPSAVSATEPAPPPPTDDETSYIAARLSDPTNLQNALRLAEENNALNVVGVRFENDQIVGEYYLESDKTPEEFLAQFADMYGTVPQSAALVVEVPKRESADKARFAPLAFIDTGLPAFVAPPMVPSELGGFFSARGSENPSEAQALAPLASPDWEPQNVNLATFRVGGSQLFLNAIDWGTATGPNDIPGSTGIEVGIDLYNGATGTRGSIIPGDICGFDFRDKFIAKNYNWNSWSVSSPSGGLAASYPYADLNDLFDSCGRNSMTIGFASPQDLPNFTPGPDANLTTFIDAKLGTTSSSRLGGGLQLVNNAACPFDGSIAFTNCMGILPLGTPSGVATARLTLSTSRGWVAATSKCWASGSWGTTTPVETAC